MHTFKDFNIENKEATLSNGTRILLLKKDGSPIHIEMAFASGSCFDPKGKEGLSHFAEHMILAGSNTFPTKDKMSTYIEGIGGIFGARTSSELMSVGVEVVDKSDFKHTGILLKEILTESLFKEATIETERGSILAEIGNKETSPTRYVWALFKTLCFQGTNYGGFILGDKKSVSSITRKDLISFYENMLTSGRATVVISGDIGLSDITSVLESSLPLRLSNDYYFEKELPVVRDKKIMVRKYPKHDQVHLAVGFRTCPAKNPDSIPLYLVSAILGGGRASTLFRRLRYEKGLVYGVSSFSGQLSRGGTYGVKTSTSKDSLQEVLDIIVDEFKHVVDGKITEQELQFIKNKLIKSKRRHLQTSASWVRNHVNDYLIRNPMTVPDELNAIEKITLEDLQRVGKKYFKKDSWYLAMCGDIEEKDFSVNY